MTSTETDSDVAFEQPVDVSSIDSRPSSGLMHKSGLPLPATTWSVADVGVFLTSLGLPQYVDIFSTNEIQGEHLVDLDREDLKELGVTSLGPRKTLVKAIEELRSTTA